jgi:hypothetical protein
MADRLKTANIDDQSAEIKAIEQLITKPAS